MAASSHPLATATALDTLRRGGNAVDAAIAASATLCVVEPHMTGVGGDCFALIVDPDGAIYGLNGSGRVPSGASPDRYRALGHRMVPAFGPLSITAPGAVKAWEALHQRFGTRSLEELFSDAIAYARDGFPVLPRVA
nr:gamma-glutamyltransferase [Mesorhizobium sp. NFR06]